MQPQTRTGATLWYYRFFSGHGRELLAEILGVADPFTLPGAEIVERVLAAGYTADLEQALREPFPTADAVSMVRHDRKMFIVSIDVEQETIMVQEQRAEAYKRED